MTRLETAAKAAYEAFYFTTNFRWEAANHETQKVWLGITAAALKAYE